MDSMLGAKNLQNVYNVYDVMFLEKKVFFFFFTLLEDRKKQRSQMLIACGVLYRVIFVQFLYMVS